MAEIYNFLEDIVPIKRMLISLAVGIISLLIVLISGLSSDFVRPEIIASRAFSAFSFSALACFIILMSGEEYAIFRTNKELEDFVDDAQIIETGEEFDREAYLYEYLHDAEEENQEDVSEESEVETESSTEGEPENTFRPMNFSNLSNQN